MNKSNYKRFSKAVAERANQSFGWRGNKILAGLELESALFRCACWRLHRTTNIRSYHMDKTFWDEIRPLAIAEYQKIIAG